MFRECYALDLHGDLQPMIHCSWELLRMQGAEEVLVLLKNAAKLNSLVEVEPHLAPTRSYACGVFSGSATSKAEYHNTSN